MNLNTIVISVPTSGNGAIPAATYPFMTSGYRPPRQGRSIGIDVVHNQNGIFKWVTDNGPNVHEWEPFEIVCADRFAQVAGGGATQQAANLTSLWRYVSGPMTLRAPDGLHTIHWTDSPLERRFVSFPDEVGDKIEYRIAVHFQEG